MVIVQCITGYIPRSAVNCWCAGTTVWGWGLLSDWYEVRNISILWELFQSCGVDGNTQGSIVLIVDNQSSVNYTSPYSEVTMCLVGSFPHHNNDKKAVVENSGRRRPHPVAGWLHVLCTRTVPVAVCTATWWASLQRWASLPPVSDPVKMWSKQYLVIVFFFAIGVTIITIGVAIITLFPSHNCDLQIIHVAEDQGPCCSVMSKL